MDALRTGIYTLYSAGGDFYNDIPGRLFYAKAEGTNISEGAYATFFIVDDNPDDVFAKEGKEVTVQFSLYSGDSSPTAVGSMKTHLETLLKDVVFTVTGWTVQNTFLQQSRGPMNVEADVESGEGRYWLTEVDFLVDLKKA